MKIYKRLTVDFTITTNEIFKHGLSLKAIGLYLYIVSKPDEWTFTIAGAMQQVDDRKESIQTGLRELEAKGFLTRRQARNGGKFAKNEWNIADKPLTGKPPAGKPLTGKPLTGKPPQVNTNIVNTNIVNTKLVKTNNTTDVVVLPDKSIQKFGNSGVNELIDYLKERMGISQLDDTPARNRQYAWNAIKKFGSVEKVKLAIDAASQSIFWKDKVTSMKQVYYKGIQFISETRSTGKGYDATNI